MRNAGLDEAQAGIKIARRNINNLRCADDATLMAESEENLNSLFLKVKDEREKAGLKLNIQKTKIMASGPITSWQIDGETVATVSSVGVKVQRKQKKERKEGRKGGEKVKRKFLSQGLLVRKQLPIFSSWWRERRSAPVPFLLGSQSYLLGGGGIIP